MLETTRISTAWPATMGEHCALYLAPGVTLPLEDSDPSSWRDWHLDQPWPTPRYVHLLADGAVHTVCYELSHFSAHQADVTAANDARAEATWLDEIAALVAWRWEQP